MFIRFMWLCSDGEISPSVVVIITAIKRRQNTCPPATSLNNTNNHNHLGVDGWIILGWISRRWDVGIWTGLGWPRIGPGGGGL